MKIKARTSTHHLKGLVQLGDTIYTPRALSLILGRSVCIRKAILGFLDDWGPPICTKKKPHPCRDEEFLKGSNNKLIVNAQKRYVSTAMELWESLS